MYIVIFEIIEGEKKSYMNYIKKMRNKYFSTHTFIKVEINVFSISIQ